MMILQTFFPAMTKIVGTLGPKSRSVEIISSCLESGMSGMVSYFSTSYGGRVDVCVVCSVKMAI